MNKKRFIFSLVSVFLLVFLLTSCKATKVGNNLQVDATPTTIAETTTDTETIAETVETTIIEETTTAEVINYCLNSYFPVEENKTWNYNEKTSQNEPVNFSVTFKEIKENSFTKVVTTPFPIIESKWVCNENGLVQTEPTQLYFIDSVIFNYEFDTKGVEGVTFPPETEIEIGKSWTVSYDSGTKMGIKDEVINAIVKIEIENKVVSIESVEVPSGKYPEALKIESKMTTNISTDKGVIREAISNSELWFVKNIGLVKQISEMDNLTATIELLSME